MSLLIYRKPLQSEAHREDYKTLRKAREEGRIDLESYKSAKRDLLTNPDESLTSSQSSLRRIPTSSTLASFSSSSSESPLRERPRKGSIFDRNDPSRVFKPEQRSQEDREAAKQEKKIRKALEAERAAMAKSYGYGSIPLDPDTPGDLRASRITTSSTSSTSTRSSGPRLGTGFKIFGRRIGSGAEVVREPDSKQAVDLSGRRRAGSLGTIASGVSGTSSTRRKGPPEDNEHQRMLADYILVGEPSVAGALLKSESSGTPSRRHSFASGDERPSFSSIRPDSSASQQQLTRRDGGIVFADDGRLRFPGETYKQLETEMMKAKEVEKPPLTAVLLQLFTRLLVTFSNTSRLFTYAKHGTVRRGSVSIYSRSAIDYDAEDSETDDFFANADESYVHLRGVLEHRAWFLSAMKWLSFERMLFSPGHHLMTFGDSGSILDLDGGGIANWSWHLSLTYPASNVQSLLLPTTPRPPPSTLHPPNLTFVTAPYLHTLTAIPSSSIDVIVSHSLPRIFLIPATATTTSPDQQIAQVLRELHRILKPRGYLELTIVDPLLNNMGPLTRAHVVRHILPVSSTPIRPAKSILCALEAMGPGSREGLWDEVKTCDMWMPTTSIGDELSTVTSRVGRFLYDELYASPGVSAGAAVMDGVVQVGEGAMWADAGIVEECERENTAFRWAKYYVRKA